MGRSGHIGRGLRGVVHLGLVFLLAGIPGCSNSAVTSTTFPVPASIALSPAPNLSMELGTNQSFLASTFTSTKATITEPVSFQSSNNAVITIAANGLACAGSWDSLSNPQVCTPGSVGVAQVTATVQGVSSPPTIVYVHQHIDHVVVNEIPPPPPLPPPPPGCSSVGQVQYYAATAYSGRTDITSTVGVFTWQSLFSNVATLNINAAGLLPGQVQVTGVVPGITSLFASIGDNNSTPIYFTTCPVQSIALTVTSSTATSETITPTIIDTRGNTILPGTFLTWSSSEPGSVSVSNTGTASAVSSGGGAAIIASCTPPSCNTGFYPSLPIYPESPVTLFTSGSSTSGTVYASSTGCGTTDGCISTIVPIAAPANKLGTFISLPTTPNSLIFDLQGAKAYLGTDSGLAGSVGLAVLDAAANTVSQVISLPGKVLDVSPDGSKVIISDTSPADGPNKVFIFDSGSSSSVNLQTTGATAADFSPDSLKAYIIAGNMLYVYSKSDALKTISLAASANDVSFLSEGAFAYVAGGAPSSVTVRRTCDNLIATDASTPPVQQIIPTPPASPAFIKTLPDATRVLAVNSPEVDIISVSNLNAAGCTASTLTTPGTPSVSNSVSSFNLGRGNFVAKQLIVSQDGTTAYILTSNPGSILVFDILGQTSSALTLLGNAAPLSASLSPNGSVLYVGANDGTVHVFDTVAGGDIQQISFPPTLCQNTAGQPFPVTCNPDLVAVKP